MIVRWARRRLAASDGGFTLPELLVSITIMAVVSTGVISAVVAVNRSLGTANATVSDLSVAKVGLERVGQLLRGGVATNGLLRVGSAAMTSATASDITFHTLTGVSVGDHPVRYRLFLESGTSRCPSTCLVEARTNPVPAAPPTPADYSATPTSRVIIRDVLTVHEGQPVSPFRYWAHPVDSGTANDRCGVELVPGTGGLTATQRQQVDSVSITVVVRGESAYDNSAVELRGWARFASRDGLGFSPSEDSAGCLDTDGGFGYDA